MESLTIHGLSTEDIHTGKESAFQCRGHKRCGFSPWVSIIPWRRKWQPHPVFLPGEFHGQRSLVGYSPWGRKESDSTEARMLLPRHESQNDSTSVTINSMLTESLRRLGFRVFLSFGHIPLRICGQLTV